jgi:N-acetylglucosamine kinase-like BadF-type ATPase
MSRRVGRAPWPAADPLVGPSSRTGGSGADEGVRPTVVARYLGVDGGQSSTLALVGDEEGEVIGVGRGGPCQEEGSLRAALEQAGALEGTFEAACFGLSGGPERQESTARELVRAKRYIFTHDAAVALTGALAGEPGIVVIAGTGSIAFGRNGDGQTARAGGWGYAFGDEGGAFDVVRQALRAMLRQEEGWGPATAMRGLFFPVEESDSAHHLIHRFYRGEAGRAELVALAPLVDQAAAAGDHAAQEILKSAAQSLATFAGAVRAQLFPPGEPVSFSYTGGVFRSPVILGRFRLLAELEYGHRVTPPVYGPAAGALLEAYRTFATTTGKTCTLKNVPEEKA